MPTSNSRPPAYRHHKARDCAVVTIRSKDHYLGTFGSPESCEKYHRLVAELLARQPDPPPLPADAPLTVTELIAQYWRFAKGYYVKGGQPTSEIHSIKLALKFVRRLYGSTPAAEFAPKKLKAVREAMVVHPITRRVKETDPDTGEVGWVRKVVRVGMARKCVNKLVGRIRRLFAWAVEEELLPVEVHAALLRVKGLKRGKTAARETPRVRPVPDEAVDRVRTVLRPTVRAMVEVQRLSGCRPQDVVQMRPRDIDRTGSVWEYRPPRFKTSTTTTPAPPTGTGWCTSGRRRKRC